MRNHSKNTLGPEESEILSRKLRLRWWTLATLSVSLLIVIIDDTIINVAVPTLQRELGASATALQWIVDAYIIVFAGLLLTMGTLSDRFGRKRFLMIGLVIFGASSVFAAYSDSTAQLVVGRGLMGLGGALIMPSTLSIIIDVFPREERVKAIGIWTGIASLGIPLGPVVGGWLLERYWWGSAFLLNVPIVLVALSAGWYLVPESRHPSPSRPDLAGMAWSTVSLTSLVFAVIEAPSRGWSSGAVVAGLLLAVISGAAFVHRQRVASDPMVDLRLFRNPRLIWGTGAMTLTALALTGLTFDLTQYLQFTKGYTPLQTGVRFLPLALGFGVAGPASQRLVQRIGTGRTVAAGMAAVAAVLVGMAQVTPDTSYWPIGVALLLIGAGIGIAFVPTTDAVMAAVPEENASLASAFNDASRQVGAALGIGILGSVTNGAYASKVTSELELSSDVTDIAKRSVAGALQVADRIGGPAGDALRLAARSALADGFGFAMIFAAALLAVGASLVWSHLPATDVGADPDRGDAAETWRRSPELESLLVTPMSTAGSDQASGGDGSVRKGSFADPQSHRPPASGGSIPHDAS